MSSKVRITGDNPSPSLLEQYPNWENALDEEDEEGQDETTLRPSENQSVIVQYVSFTAATVWLNDGRECPAIIEMIYDVEGLQFYLEDIWYRIVRRSDRTGKFERWEPYVEYWIPEAERNSPPLLLNDEKVFPLRFASRLPFYKTSSLIRIKIFADGSEDVWI
jgi:hypothetical protein